MKKLIACCLVFALNAVAFDAPNLPVEEQLLGVTKTSTGLNFQVTSYGCTQMSDFAFKAEQQEGRPNFYQISVIRTKPDYCEMVAPNGKTLSMTFSELGIPEGSYYQIMNPIMGSNHPMR